MKKLTSRPSVIEIAHFKNLLESEGIEAVVRNEHLGSIVGEMPFQEVWPQLWVVNDFDYDRAKQLIDESLIAESPSAPWKCPDCGTEIEGQFGACWQCGASNV